MGTITRQATETRGEAMNPSRREDPQHHTSRPFRSQSGSHGAASDMSTSSARPRLVWPSHRPTDATTRTGYNDDSGLMHAQEAMSVETEQAPSRWSRNPLLGGMPPPASTGAAHLQSWTDQFSQRYPRTLEAQLGLNASQFYSPLFIHPQPTWFGPNAANVPFIGNYQSVNTFGDGSAFASLLRELPQGDLNNLNLRSLRLGAGFSIPNTTSQHQSPLFPNPPNAALYGDAFYPGALQQPSQPLNHPQNVAQYPSQSGGIGLSGPYVHQTGIASSTGLNKVKKRAVLEPFPARLHRLLTEVEAAGQSDIISFSEDGLAFFIHKPREFFQNICKVYFRQRRLSSFKRQLNLYGFELIARGPNKGGYYHEYFQRDHPELVQQVRRNSSRALSKEKKKGSNSKSAPDFYSMPPVISEEAEKNTAATSNASGSNGEGDRKMSASDRSRRVESASDSNGNGSYSDMRPVGYSEDEYEKNHLLMSDMSERGVEELEKEMEMATNNGSNEEEEEQEEGI